MPSDSHILKSAESGLRLFERDRTAGFAVLKRLVADWPHDGAVNLHYAEACEILGQRATAHHHFRVAAEKCYRDPWKARAVHRAARTGPEDSTGAAVISDATPAARYIPTPIDLARARAVFIEQEPRAVVYDACALLLTQALRSESKLSTALPVAALLQSWNFAYYEHSGPRLDSGHVREIETVLNRLRRDLDHFRSRSIDTLTDADRPRVAAVFGGLEGVVKRVGAAKALHLWAPDFFPIWDNPIAQAYGFDFEVGGPRADDYWSFMTLVREQVKTMAPLQDRSRLKALDEYNYCRYSKRWI